MCWAGGGFSVLLSAGCILQQRWPSFAFAGFSVLKTFCISTFWHFLLISLIFSNSLIFLKFSLILKMCWAASLFCWARGAFRSSGGRHLHSRAFQFWKHFAFHHFGIFCWLSDALFISFIWGLVPWNVWTFDINKRLSTNWFILFGVSKVKLNKRNQQIVRPQYCPFSEVTDLTNCLYIDIISFWEPPSCCFVWFCLWVGGLYGL